MEAAAAVRLVGVFQRRSRPHHMALQFSNNPRWIAIRSMATDGDERVSVKM